MSDVMNSTFALHVLDAEEIESFLMCHYKYLANPLTESERALIGDIVRVARPLTRFTPEPLGWLKRRRS